MKRAGSFILIVILILQLATPASAAYMPKPELYHFESLGVGEYGYEDFILVDENGNEVKKPETSSTKADLLYSLNLPSSYDSREYGYITSVKNQGNAGNCWAFGGISAFESDSIVKGIDDLETANYSEAHLVWFSKNSATTDTTHPTYGEGSTNPNPYTGSSAGGNWRYITNALARWSGLAEDSDYPFYPYNASSMGNYPESQRYDIGSGIVINSTEMMLDDNDMKQWIIEHGSVTAAYYHNDAYLNTSTYAYNCNATLTSNHLITIVGWDDNYSRENFLTNYRPSSNGAWLVKNSWGEYWGLDGYFWLSYEDPSITQQVGFTSRSAGKAKNNYTYTAEGKTYTISLAGVFKYSNVFTAKDYEILSDVATYTCNPNTDLIISIYTSLPQNYTNPSQGTLAATWSTHVDREGYHTFEVPNEVMLTPGMIYSVVFQTDCPDVEKNQAPMEHINYPAKAGESFFGTKYSWYDNTQYNYANYCVQALTSEHEHQTETITTDSTCSQEGYIEEKCTICGEITSKTVLPLKEHNYAFKSILDEHPHTTTSACTMCSSETSQDGFDSKCVYCNFTLTTDGSDSYTISQYIGQWDSVTVPSEIDGKAVTTINNSCFRDAQNIKTVEIGDGITEISSMAFMNCTSLEGIFIPSSVTTIGAQAFYGCNENLIIYCNSGSVAHNYAIENNIKFILIDITNSDETTIDINNKIIFTKNNACSDSENIITFSDSSQVISTASFKNGNTEYLGTGSKLTIFDNGVYVTDYTIVVIGDLNGDSVCDVLDATKTEQIINGHDTATDIQMYAANGYVGNSLDITSYQFVVNTALAN